MDPSWLILENLFTHPPKKISITKDNQKKEHGLNNKDKVNNDYNPKIGM